MITVTLKDLADWAKAQPADRPVNMGHYKLKNDKWHGRYDDGDDCGCLMVQYGLDKGWKFTSCCSSDWSYYHREVDYIARLDRNNEDLNNVWDLFKDPEYSLSDPNPETGETYGVKKEFSEFKGTFGELVKLFKPEYQ